MNQALFNFIYNRLVANLQDCTGRMSFDYLIGLLEDQEQRFATVHRKKLLLRLRSDSEYGILQDGEIFTRQTKKILTIADSIMNKSQALRKHKSSKDKIQPFLDVIAEQIEDFIKQQTDWVLYDSIKFSSGVGRYVTNQQFKEIMLALNDQRKILAICTGYWTNFSSGDLVKHRANVTRDFTTPTNDWIKHFKQKAQICSGLFNHQRPAHPSEMNKSFLNDGGSNVDALCNILVHEGKLECVYYAKTGYFLGYFLTDKHYAKMADDRRRGLDDDCVFNNNKVSL